MIVWVRKLLENWVARGFFALLVIGFVFWGISNVTTLIGSNTAVARVGGQDIDVSLVQAAYQRALNQASQNGQGQPDLATRRQLALGALSGVLRQQVLQDEQRRLGVVVPDSALRAMIGAIPAFQTNGAFDEQKFNQVLQQNNITPDHFIGEIKDDIAGRQMLGAILGGVAPPDELLKQLFSYIAEQRFAAAVNIPFAAQAQPKPPGDDVLQRFWHNNPALFTSPELRTAKIVILSPALLAPKEVVAQADVDAAYDRAAAATPPAVPLRSVQVISVDNLAASSRLEAAWKRNASWAEMQAMAKKFGASTIELKQAKQVEIPSPTLGAAVFAAQPGQVNGPVAGTNGMYVFKVTDVSASGTDAAALRAQVLQSLQMQKAQADVAQDVDNLQDALAGQTPLDQLPGSLGLTAVEGTLDANGNAAGGTPAPIPGGADLKAAIVKAVFAAHAGDPAQLTNGPDGSYFALTVSAVTPPALQPYAQVQAKVLSAWTQQEITREAEVQAASLMQAVNQGQSLADAAKAIGASVSMTQGFTRAVPPSGIPSQMVPVLFTLKPGQATMQQTDSGFSVAALVKIVQPDPAADPADYAQLQQAMTKELQNDAGESLLSGLQKRDKVTVDQKLLAQIYQ
ncbi:peptidyl-prolyl cis-trans isomerase [Acidocella aquatica]|uniref:Peptidyl-prolyl cis-trans isomerase n=1 Tax=Acidocella aquatica TaxID=1922313 RepID=A0ABQ6A2J8_9PROT|nr:peptidylprolyl isomerase [Acidocella aquatica]GLR66666.1 peptidyl-prolyl cis-trans isomerase [Acidocella aquatica]